MARSPRASAPRYERTSSVAWSSPGAAATLLAGAGVFAGSGAFAGGVSGGRGEGVDSSGVAFGEIAMRAGVALAAGRGRGVADAFDVARGVTLGIALGVALGLTVGGRDAVGVGVGEEAW
ncbi:MAG TPA: hypothetical protein VHT92_01535 [Candidatus Cybelea sp.]|nr:hypothetical protein [Candidatus Cybelea sp.]